MIEIDSQEGEFSSGRFLARLNLFWALIFYLSLGLGLAGALFGQADPLRGWPLGAALVLTALSAGLFHWFYLRVLRDGRSWPLTLRQGLVYFGGQIVLLTLLLALRGDFVALGFALMGQAFGTLRPRHWFLPLIPIFLLIAWPAGLFVNPGQIDLGALLGLSLAFGSLVGAALLISQLFQQRYQLLGLVAELRRAKDQIEAGAAQQEELAVLRERTRLAREMHDSIGHALVSVNVKLEAAQRLYRVDAARGDAELEATRALVRETMAELRRSLADLRAPLPDHRDLAVALRGLAAELSARSGVQVDLAVPERAPAPAVAETLYLIAREALANVERHARASQAELSLGCVDGCWSLRVADDGVGLRPADLTRPGHFGVIGMRERAEALGGKLRIGPRPGGGTLVEVTVPAQE